MWTKSKKVQNGTLVSLRGGKLIVCSNLKQILGVYTNGSHVSMFDMSGARIKIQIPEGIIFYGPAQVRVSKTAAVGE